MEVWRDIKGFEGLYQVSNLGNIRSFVHTGRKMKGGYYDESVGYRKIRLAGKVYRICRLVAEAFIPNPNNLPCVNHINENRVDDRVENLEWCTYQYNNTYGGRLERVHKANKEHPNGYNRKPILIDGVRYESSREAARCLDFVVPSAITRSLREGKTHYKGHKIDWC